MAFPTLSQGPEIDGWEESIAYDPTIKSPTDGGYVLTRARFTRLPKQWRLIYRYLPSSDVSSLKTWESGLKVGSQIDTWLNPLDSQTYYVRLLEPIRYKLHSTTSLWDVELVLVEV